MILQYYVTKSATGSRTNIEIEAATKEDLEITKSGWQTVWNTDFILDPQKEKYVAKRKLAKLLHWGPTVFVKEV